MVNFKKRPYLGIKATNQKSKTTFFSSTLKVRKKKVPLFFYFRLPCWDMANLSFLDSIVHCVNILVSKVHYASYLDYKGEFCKNKHVSYFKHYTRGQGNVNFKNSECCPNHHFCHLMWGFILHLVILVSLTRKSNFGFQTDKQT